MNMNDPLPYPVDLPAFSALDTDHIEPSIRKLIARNKAEIARLLAGELSIAETMQTIEAGWSELNDELGLEEQLDAYRATLGR